MNIDNLFAIFVILIVVAGLSLMYKSWLEGKKGGKDVKKAKDEILKKKLNDAQDKYLSEFKACEADNLQPLLARDFSLFNKTIPYLVEGAGPSMDWLKQAMTETDGQSIFNKKVVNVSGDAAVVTFSWMRGKLSGKTTHVWRFSHNDGWMLVHEHTSQNPKAE